MASREQRELDILNMFFILPSDPSLDHKHAAYIL